ncbi:hypothetical protein AX774_g6513 [Zancudomyces culisetae]|uniref:Uncharacterized protein n=1 Tax=Zancudomyces culisetae TaxID=1213189 RepID=A0A1R1PGG8_ZANCU|nr:hypothetical protein AX774_g6513 [Zancudomyces culisetae]|eukprot:OMH80071.1 hypothetical protein AX774_g6513 [Zancudomyces culisetae]
MVNDMTTEKTGTQERPYKRYGRVRSVYSVIKTENYGDTEGEKQELSEYTLKGSKKSESVDTYRWRHGSLSDRCELGVLDKNFIGEDGEESMASIRRKKRVDKRLSYNVKADPRLSVVLKNTEKTTAQKNFMSKYSPKLGIRLEDINREGVGSNFKRESKSFVSQSRDDENSGECSSTRSSLVIKKESRDVGAVIGHSPIKIATENDDSTSAGLCLTGGVGHIVGFEPKSEKRKSDTSYLEKKGQGELSLRVGYAKLQSVYSEASINGYKQKRELQHGEANKGKRATIATITQQEQGDLQQAAEIAELKMLVEMTNCNLKAETERRIKAETKLKDMEQELAELSNNIQLEAQSIVVTERIEKKNELEKMDKQKREAVDLLEMERAQVTALKTTLENCGRELDQESKKNQKLAEQLERMQRAIERLQKEKNELSERLKQKEKVANGVLTSVDSQDTVVEDVHNDVQLVSTNKIAEGESKRIDIENQNIFYEKQDGGKSQIVMVSRMKFLDRPESESESEEFQQFLQCKTDKDSFNTQFFQKIFKEEIEPALLLSFASNSSTSLIPSWSKYKRLISAIQENTLLLQVNSSIPDQSSPSSKKESDEPASYDGLKSLTRWFSSPKNKPLPDQQSHKHDQTVSKTLFKSKSLYFYQQTFSEGLCQLCGCQLPHSITHPTTTARANSNSELVSSAGSVATLTIAAGLASSKDDQIYHLLRYSDSDPDPKPICLPCHARILCVCELYHYLRLVRSGVVKSQSVYSIYLEILRLRIQIYSRRIGATSSTTLLQL